MTIVKTCDVFCDGNYGPQCRTWCDGASVTEQHGGSVESRKMAARYGWTRRNGKDYCPACSVIGEWDGDYFKAIDGRTFAIFSEHPRGESRWYCAMERTSADAAGVTVTGRNWRDFPGDGSTNKNVQRRRVERYVRETL